MTFPKEFKDAISNLSSAEKDKLIFRLLKKDPLLANRLLFELLSEETVDQKRKKLEEKLKFETERAVRFFQSPGYLSMDVRFMSGTISEHVKITKDKFGDPWLNLFMLNQLTPALQKDLRSFSPRQAEKFYVPALARIFKILINIAKLHVDEQYEFREELQKLAKYIGDNDAFMRTAINHGLVVNWLYRFEIPEDIVEIHRNIREMGFLR